MSQNEGTAPCGKCQESFLAALPVCPFCGHRREGMTPGSAVLTDEPVAETMARALEQGCPHCHGPGHPLPIFVETWEDAGLTLTMKQQYQVRSANIPGYCSACSTGLNRRRWIAAAVHVAPLWAISLLSLFGNSPGLAIVGVMYGFHLLKRSDYSWADQLVYGTELEMNLHRYISPMKPEGASVRFPIGCLHSIFRLLFFMVSTILILIGAALAAAPPMAPAPAAVDEEERSEADSAQILKPPFQEAQGMISRKDVKGLADLLLRRPNLRFEKDGLGATLLHYASIGDDGPTIKALVKAGCDNDAPDLKEGFTPLHWAARAGKAVTLEALLETGAKINAHSEVGHTPLHIAVLEKRLQICEILLRKGAEVNSRTQTGRTPLYFARIKNFPEAETLLKSHGATE